MPSNESPQISVIMPVYNGEMFLDEAIQSILNQSYPHWELIIVDDGSTDSTPIILERYRNHPNVRIFLGKHQGVSAARNLAIQNARGEFLAFIDADDVYYPDGLEKLYNAIQTNSQYDVVHAFFTSISESGEPAAPQGIVLQTDSKGEYVLPVTMPYSWDAILTVRFSCALWSALFRKSVFDKLGLLRTDLTSWEDYEYFVRVFKDSPSSILAIPEYVYYYRFNPSSHSKSLTNDAKIMTSVTCFLKVFETIFASADLPEEVARKKGIYYAQFYRRYAYIFQRQGLLSKVRYIARLALSDQSVDFYSWLRIFGILYMKSCLPIFLVSWIDTLRNKRFAG